MKFLKFDFGVILLALVLIFNACKPTDEEPFQDYSSGVFITCEGKFTGGSGTVDFYNRQIGGIQNDIYAKENNGAALGNVLQSMTVHNDTAFLVVNNANKIVLVNFKTFKSLGTFEGFALPRNYLYLKSTYSYLSYWGADGISGGVGVFDHATKKVVKTIATGKGADKMMIVDNAVYVLNTGGFGKDSTVSIINPEVDTVYKTVKVGLGPNSMVRDANGDIWVLCSSYFDKTETGTLVKIRNQNQSVEYSFSVPKGATGLTTNRDKSILYFIASNKIYQKDILNFGANQPAVLLAPTYFSNPYNLGVDPKTGFLFCGDAKDYSSAGTAYIFDPTTKVLKDSIKTGVIPSHFYFY